LSPFQCRTVHQARHLAAVVAHARENGR
jgi:hypothetical protein